MNIVLDMDGTIADLYAVDCWLEKLLAEDETPYADAAPLVDMDKLAAAIAYARERGCVVSIVSWCAKGTPSKDYKKRTRAAKVEWLKRHNIEPDHVHVVAHGTDKYTVARRDWYNRKMALIDDEKGNRDSWNSRGGTAYDVTDVIGTVYKLASEINRRG